MAKRSLNITSITPTATADATNLANSTYLGLIQGGSTTQKIAISEIFMGGQASANAPSIMLLSRDSTVGATVVAGTTVDAALDSSTAALAAPPVVGNSATTAPQRAAAGHVLSLSFNAFGGIVRWLAAPGEEIMQYGNAVNIGETSLSAFTGGTTGAMSSHIVYEPS